MKLSASLLVGFVGVVGLAQIALGVEASAGDAKPAQRDVRDVVGCSHINTLYGLTEKDFMNEGADQLLKLGTRVIKLVIRDHLEGYYSLHSQWPEIDSLVQAARLPYFQEVFSKPFSTFVLMTFTPGKDIHYFLKGMTPEDVQREEASFYEFAKYLLTTYQGTGKTFVLQNWEGDWVLTPPYTDKQLDPKEADAMVVWLNARQDGVERARREVGTNGVMVVHAAEANLVDKAMQGKPCVANNVFPHTHCDLYSYSAYDIILQGPERLRAALDHLAAKAPDSPLYGAKNVYIGEFGWPENLVTPAERLKIVKGAVETALDWGTPYVLFWELYCDVPRRKYEGRPTNDDMSGNWLIRPDGTKCPIWDYFEAMFRKADSTADMAPFACVATWDPARLDGVHAHRLMEFPADDVFLKTELSRSEDGTFTVPERNGLGCIGLHWLGSRALAEVGIELADEASMPPMESARVEIWIKQVSSGLVEYSEWQGKWTPIQGKIRREGKWWKAAIHADGETPVASDTIQVRWIFPATGGQPRKVRRLTAITKSHWETADLRFEAEEGAAQGTARIELYNGQIIGESDSDRLHVRQWSLKEPLHLKVRYTQPAEGNLDRTVLRIAMPTGAFGVAVDDVLTNGCVYVKTAGLFVAKEPNGKSLAEYKNAIAGQETFLEQVRHRPDQTFSQAIQALYAPIQDRSPTLLSLGWDNRKTAVDRFGMIHFGSPQCVINYQLMFRYEIDPKFGSGTNAGYQRALEEGWMPIPHFQVKDGGIVYRQKSYVAPWDRDASPKDPYVNGRPLGVVEYTLDNPESSEAGASLRLSFGEYARTVPGKPIEIGSLDAIQDAQIARTPLKLSTLPGMVVAKQGEQVVAIVDVRGIEPMKIECKDDVLSISGPLPAKSKACCAVYVPLEWELTSDEAGRIVEDKSLLKETKDYWRRMMAPAMQIEIPDPLLQNVIQASQAHCIIASRSPKNEGKLIDPWIASTYYCSLDTESHALIYGMDLLGHKEYARRALDFFVQRLNPAGYLAHGYTLMGTGQHLWFLSDHYRLTGDKAWWQALAPTVDKVCQWIIAQTEKTKRLDPSGEKVPSFGLLPPGTVADWQTWGYTFSMEGYYYAGLNKAAAALAEVGDPQADRFAEAARQLRENILRAYRWNQARMPVVPRGNGTWVPGMPFMLSWPGPIKDYFSDASMGPIWIYEVELGANHMVDEGVLDADGEDAGQIADYLENVQFLRDGTWAPAAPVNLPAEATRSDWFNKGGFPRAQPYYARYVELLARRDDVKPFIRSYMNQLAIMFNREDLTIYENPWASVWNKTHETGHFLQQTRLMFLMERGDELWLSPFVTQHWLKDGMDVKIRQAPSFFGPVQYEIQSHVKDGYIDAKVELAARKPPKAIVFRLRHPDGKPMKKAAVDGAEMIEFDAAKEIVRFKPAAGAIHVRAEY